MSRTELLRRIATLEVAAAHRMRPPLWLSISPWLPALSEAERDLLWRLSELPDADRRHPERWAAASGEGELVRSILGKASDELTVSALVQLLDDLRL